MVQGAARLRAQFDRVPVLVRDEVEKAIAKMATEMVREMRALAPLPEIAGAIDWTWGEAPKGSLTIKRLRGGKEYGRIQATVFASARTSEFPGGFAAVAGWFEFGTAPRFHKSGKSTGRIEAQPFFYPVLRANRRLFQGRIRAAVNRAMKRANQSR